ncbi:hypothetical protein HanXRQr2_Chr15g0701341 [Helianthus annuus]|uniref:Uncharacterized protein n=1 Tax=Helianthus annuus TaxID=4232 RepID=A0A9K3E1X6_HELAN|nr:hypothetical protein HanXRQr2_Chr15g0701341 [Helianthus annuus]KAJ0831938.1 hypothetical protein HanPSC8_Chr15g0672981 [Helianthus annuus]
MIIVMNMIEVGIIDGTTIEALCILMFWNIVFRPKQHPKHSLNMIVYLNDANRSKQKQDKEKGKKNVNIHWMRLNLVTDWELNSIYYHIIMDRVVSVNKKVSKNL